MQQHSVFAPWGRTKKFRRNPKGTAEDNTVETLVESGEISCMILVQTNPAAREVIAAACHSKKQQLALQIPGARCDGGMQTVPGSCPVPWESTECGQGHSGPSGSLCLRQLPHFLEPRDRFVSSEYCSE